MNFDDAFVDVVGIEGGYSNRPGDPGGETKYGITIAVARKHGYNGPMQDLPLDFAKKVYKTDYWDPLQADQLPFCLAEFLFDFAVNSGTQRAAVALQQAVGALPDGAVGPKTLALVPKHTPRHIMRLVFVARAKVMAHSPVLHANENGWFARLFDVTTRAIDQGA